MLCPIEDRNCGFGQTAYSYAAEVHKYQTHVLVTKVATQQTIILDMVSEGTLEQWQD